MEHADAGQLRHRILDQPIIVNNFTLRELLRCEGYVVILVEVVGKRRHPIEAPTHPLLKCRQLLEWRAGDRCHADITLVQVDDDAFEISRWFRWTMMPLKLSAQNEQLGHPSSQLGSNMK